RDPFVARKIRSAEALFIAGGDQWNYVRLWRGSPVGEAVPDGRGPGAAEPRDRQDALVPAHIGEPAEAPSHVPRGEAGVDAVYRDSYGLVGVTPGSAGRGRNGRRRPE